MTQADMGVVGIVPTEDARSTPPALYGEKYRPQFHFTARQNWLNDPNGLVFYAGEYHLFFQHNPTGINWGNMTWGHAVSTDLVHWTPLEHAIHPDELGAVYSGSAVIDWNNTSGFQIGDEKPMVCIYTSAGDQIEPPRPFTQSIAYSNDRGRSWTRFDGNPVLSHIEASNRDPKVFWHAPTHQWIMALYLDAGRYVLHGSPNLKEWTKLSDVPTSGADECPDMFEMSVDGDRHNTRWVFWDGNSNYLIGHFDGAAFTSESGPFRFEHGNNFYAAQSYNDIPAEDGRRIQIGWMREGRYPEMPFNQQMSFPRELQLRSCAQGIQLFCTPVAEIDCLTVTRHEWYDVTVDPGENLLRDVSGGLYDVRLRAELGGASRVLVNCLGEAVSYDVASKSLACVGRECKLDCPEGVLNLRILVDRTSLEVFANDGQVVLSSCFLPDPANTSLELVTEGGTLRVLSMKVSELRSAWGNEG